MSIRRFCLDMSKYIRTFAIEIINNSINPLKFTIMEYKEFTKRMNEKKGIVYAGMGQVIYIFPLRNYMTCIEINIHTSTNKKGDHQYFKATNTVVEMEAYDLIETLEKQGYSRIE